MVLLIELACPSLPTTLEYRRTGMSTGRCPWLDRSGQEHRSLESFTKKQRHTATNNLSGGKLGFYLVTNSWAHILLSQNKSYSVRIGFHWEDWNPTIVKSEFSVLTPFVDLNILDFFNNIKESWSQQEVCLLKKIIHSPIWHMISRT